MTNLLFKLKYKDFSKSTVIIQNMPFNLINLRGVFLFNIYLLPIGWGLSWTQKTKVVALTHHLFLRIYIFKRVDQGRLLNKNSFDILMFKHKITLGYNRISGYQTHR